MKIKPYTRTELCWNELSGLKGKWEIDSHFVSAILKGLQHLPALTKFSFIWRPKFTAKKGPWDKNGDKGLGAGLSAWKWEIHIQRSAQISFQKPYLIKTLLPFWSGHLTKTAGEKESEFLLLSLSVSNYSLSVKTSAYTSERNIQHFVIYHIYSSFRKYSCSYFQTSPWQERPVIVCTTSYESLKVILRYNILVKQQQQQK